MGTRDASASKKLNCMYDLHANASFITFKSSELISAVQNNAEYMKYFSNVNTVELERQMSNFSDCLLLFIKKITYTSNIQSWIY